ncbi:DnaJ domain-containing protein [Bradyrhizobium lablabi]|uniref:J domain-containing protein n=1 Tax=Bradyrhizobium lablabi TaxID=722472 RepID=UPI001BAAEB59|nr:J domain-containing protein [Bradyrhizobium lablabi]MBR1120258.1 DnaJ domain-containing protein [Bradyrhizobium lablabi]
MGTLYDLLGALPNDDAEGLRAAFRKAAKATHPDLNPDNPEAALRFRQLVRAHDILSDAEQRATYDQLLAIATKPVPTKSSQVYEKVHRFASSTIAATIIAAILVASYTLMGVVSRAPVAAESTVGMAGGKADIETVAISGRHERTALADEIFKTSAIAPKANARSYWMAGPVPLVAGDDIASSRAPGFLASLGASKRPALTDLQRDLGFLPLYSAHDVGRAFAGMERTRLRAKARQARIASHRPSTARVLDAPPVLRPTRMTQATTP